MRFGELKRGFTANYAKNINKAAEGIGRGRYSQSICSSSSTA